MQELSIKEIVDFLIMHDAPAKPLQEILQSLTHLMQGKRNTKQEELEHETAKISDIYTVIGQFTEIATPTQEVQRFDHVQFERKRP